MRGRGCGRGSGRGAEALLRLDKLTRRFGTALALDALSLEVAAGEFVALLGGSGSGKSTLLRLVAGFDRPDAGRILLGGADITALPPQARDVAMMFQSYALFPHMTVAANVAFGLEQEGLARAEIDRRVGEMLDIVKLGDFGRRKPHQLSGGQRQRVALARALVKRPKLLLLDEPLGALDRKLREHTQFELINLQEQLGVTFVVVTHDQEEAMTLASRIGVMNKGQIVQVGTPTEIYEFPSSRFVADFIGSVNMFDGQLVEDEPGHVRIRCPELEATVYVSHGISAAPDAKVSVAIRPEKIEMTRTAPEGSENRARGVVKEIAYMGDMSVYLVRLDSGRMVRVTIPNIERHDERLVWEETVHLNWHPSSPVVLSQ